MEFEPFSATSLGQSREHYNAIYWQSCWKFYRTSWKVGGSNFNWDCDDSTAWEHYNRLDQQPNNDRWWWKRNFVLEQQSNRCFIQAAGNRASRGDGIACVQTELWFVARCTGQIPISAKHRGSESRVWDTGWKFRTYHGQKLDVWYWQ